MTFQHARRWPLFIGLAAVGCTLAPTEQPAAQPGWSFQLAWDHPGAGAFRLCVNGQCQPLAAQWTGGGGWRAPLPLLAPGEYRLVVEACAGQTCVPGQPDLFVRVSQPSTNRPPIDVLEGPRIQLDRR